METSKKKKRNKGTRFMVIGLGLIVAALFLTTYNLWEERSANQNADQVLAQMYAIRDQNRNAFSEMIPDYLLNSHMDMPKVTIDSNEYIGVLEIPALNLSLPVMKDWSYKKLKISPNCFQGSVYTDNMIIAGHNYRTHFGSLKLLSPGDEVLFTDVDENLFTYEVADIETLQETQTEEMKTGDWDLTLFTCTLGGGKVA